MLSRERLRVVSGDFSIMSAIPSKKSSVVMLYVMLLNTHRLYKLLNEKIPNICYLSKIFYRYLSNLALHHQQ